MKLELDNEFIIYIEIFHQAENKVFGFISSHIIYFPFKVF